MKRRQLAIAAAGAVALGAGALVYVRTRPVADPPLPATPLAGLWAMRFPRPGGGEVSMAQFLGRPLLLNFWATWCAPCIREMPELDRFAKQFAATGWQVVGIAVDQEKPVAAFLAQNPVSYPIALAGWDGVALATDLGNKGGGLPYTVTFDRRGTLRHKHLGESHLDLWAAWARDI